MAKSTGVLKQEDIQALGIRTWQEARNSINLDLEDFVSGYVQAWQMWMDGFI